MATKLFLRDTTGNGIGGATSLDMLIAAGPGFVAYTVTTTASGTQIQWTDAPGGSVIEWVSGRVPAGGFTLAGTMTFSAWCNESAMGVNAGARARVFKWNGSTYTEIAGGPWNDGVEFSVTPALTEMVWTGTPTSTAFSENDRLVFRLYATNVGTMGAGSAGVAVNAADATDGDSFFQITENVTFKAETVVSDVPLRRYRAGRNTLLRM